MITEHPEVLLLPLALLFVSGNSQAFTSLALLTDLDNIAEASVRAAGWEPCPCGRYRLQLWLLCLPLCCFWLQARLIPIYVVYDLAYQK